VSHINGLIDVQRVAITEAGVPSPAKVEEEDESRAALSDARALEAHARAMIGAIGDHLNYFSTYLCDDQAIASDYKAYAERQTAVAAEVLQLGDWFHSQVKHQVKGTADRLKFNWVEETAPPADEGVKASSAAREAKRGRFEFTPK